MGVSKVRSAGICKVVAVAAAFAAFSLWVGCEGNSDSSPLSETSSGGDLVEPPLDYNPTDTLPPPNRVRQFTVAFNTNGGTPELIPPVVVDSGAGLGTMFPADPTKEQDIFGGWFNGVVVYTDRTPITEDLSLTAFWKLTETGPSKDEDENQTIEKVAFSEYSLAGNPCEWARNYDYFSDVAIINSDEDLGNYVECAGGDYPEIDFSKHTLLLAHGREGHVVIPNYTNLLRLSEQNYKLEVNLLPTMLDAITFWQVPIIVDKIADGSAIELVVTKNVVMD